MNRLAIRIVGAQGQGLYSIGEIVGKGLKREGYCIFGYREYMSLIKGGHTGYQVDVDSVPVRSSKVEVDVVLTMNYQGITRYLPAGRQGLRPSRRGPSVIREGGYLVHDIPDWEFSEEDKTILEERRITVIVIPTEDILKELNAPPILQNTIFTGYLWKALGRDKEALKAMVRERYAKKEKLIPINEACVEKGYDFEPDGNKPMKLSLPAPVGDWKDNLLITGNEAAGLGAIHAGVRLYAGYPMTPSSSLLAYVAKKQGETGMIVKQAEDEITAAQIAAGGYFMGTRAMTATSGGGFDLMTETLGMIAMTETPMVFILAQRPGPSTGVPTWTTQGDLFLALHAGHGEFPRCVLALSDAADAFFLTAEAHNIAERYQIPVIVLTDKHLAEGLYCTQPYDMGAVTIDRGALVTDEGELKNLKPADRFRITGDGVSRRWVPGQEAEGYCANSDEHTEDGTVTEDAGPVKDMMGKRMRKEEALREELPEPALYVAGGDGDRDRDRDRDRDGDRDGDGDGGNVDVLVVGWGSTKGVVLDVLDSAPLRGPDVLNSAPLRGRASSERASSSIGYLHFTYLWPLKTERFIELQKKAKRTILIEGNYQGQLGKLLRMETGVEIKEKLLKYDGRPFFFEEVRDALTSQIPQTSPL